MKIVLFPEIGRVKIFYHSSALIVECVSEYIFLIKKKNNKKQTKLKKKREYLTGYNDIVCEFALCTFNLLDRVVNFSWFLYEFNVVYVQ